MDIARLLKRRGRRDDTAYTDSETSMPVETGQGPIKMVNTIDLEPDDIVIAVMGPTGSGKSTFLCSASGRDTSGIGHTLKSCTDQVSAIKFWDPASGRPVVLVDTPGFDDTFKSDLEVLNMISDWLVSSYNKKKLLSGILYLHRITDNRMAGTPLKNLRVFRKLCGKDALDSVYLTTTMWDEVDPDVGEKRLDELQTEYWRTMINLGAQVACYRSDDDSAKRLVQQIIYKESKRNDAQNGMPAPQPPTEVSHSHLLDAEQQPKMDEGLARTVPAPEVTEKTLNLQDLEADDIIVAVMGPTGSAKSTESPLKVLLIQEEMVELKKELKETAAGQQLYSHLEMLVEKQKELLRRIDKEQKAASDANIMKELQTEYNELRAQMDDKLRQMQELKLPWLKRCFARR